jgi:hypothetical protein
MQSKEIDLLKLLCDFYSFIKRGVIYILVIEFVFIIGGYYYHKKTENNIQYSKTFVITSEYVSDYLIVEILNSIDQSNSNMMAKQLNISNEISNKISSISPETRIYGDKQTSVNCKFQFLKKEYALKIEQAILTFVKNKEFVKKKYLASKNYNETLLNAIDQKLIRFGYVNGAFNDEEREGVNSFDITFYNLLKQREQLIKDLNSYNEIDLVDSTITKIEKTPNSITLNIIISLFLGGLFSFFFLFVKGILFKMRHYVD